MSDTTESSARDFDEATRDVVSDALADQPAGSQASGQTQGQADHPHDSASGQGHVDGWEGTKEADGSVSFEKGHASDG